MRALADAFRELDSHFFVITGHVRGGVLGAAHRRTHLTRDLAGLRARFAGLEPVLELQRNLLEVAHRAAQILGLGREVLRHRLVHAGLACGRGRESTDTVPVRIKI